MQKLFDRFVASAVVVSFLVLIGAAAYRAADMGNGSVFSQTDASNNSGTAPSFAEGMLPSAVNDNARALQGALKRFYDQISCSVASTGSSNAYVLTYSVAPAALYNGQRFCFEANFANTSTSTVNINSLGAKTIKKEVAGVQTNLASGDIASGDHVTVIYDTSSDVLIMEPGWNNRVALDGTNAWSGENTFTNTGLHILDTNASHDLIIKPGSDITADRQLTITTGDAARTLTITADSSIGGTAYVASGTDVAIADGGTGASTAANAFTALKQDATTSATGVCELATTSEAAAMSDTGRCITPEGLKYRPEAFCVAVSDETTAITTGTAKITFRMPYAFTVTAVRASVNTVSSSGLPTFDINEGGTTIISTKLTIDANEKTSTTAATAAVISDSSLADDAEMTIDIDTAGTGAKGAKVCIIGRPT